MATTTVHLPEAKLEQLKRLARHRGVSLSRLIEEWSNLAEIKRAVDEYVC